jgi:multidrug efflux pump subunit AcrA (membrane-fusion protein)
MIVLRAGGAAQVELPSVPGLALEATVRSVAPAVDPATGTGAVRFALVLAADGPRPPIGVVARARATVASRDALTVPIDALRGSSQGGTEVLVCEDGVVRARAVTVGLRGERAEITSGLDGSESIVVSRVIGIDDETPLADPDAPETEGAP